MKIGFFTATYYPTPDGVSHYLKEIKHELEARGHEVHVFSFKGDKKEKNVHIPVTYPLPIYPQYSVPLNPFPMYLYRIAQKIGFDLIHIHDPFMGSVGYRLARSDNIPVVATFHTDFVNMKSSVRMPMKDTLFNLTWRYNKFLYSKCDKVLAPSLKAKEYLDSEGIANTEELPLFVDIEKYRNSRKQDDPFIVQYLGRITRDKGIMKVLDVAEQLRNNKGIRFVISGIGPEEDIVSREIASRNLEENVSMTGYVDERRKLELFSTANLFIYPSETDTFGISVLEALSSGIPAMIPRGFPLTHYDGKKDSGLVISDFSSPTGIAENIVRLKTDPQKLGLLNASARDFVISNFSREKHCDRLLEVYSHLVASAR